MFRSSAIIRRLPTFSGLSHDCILVSLICLLKRQSHEKKDHLASISRTGWFKNVKLPGKED